MDPYPGYVHGRNRAICPNGCFAEDEKKTKREDFRQKLLRECEEFVRLYYKEHSFDDETERAEKCERRVKECLKEIEANGTYEHTIDEIRFGARVSWRNAPKCIYRKFYNVLEVIVARACDTNEEMFEAVKTHLRRAIGADHVPVLMTVFKPESPFDPNDTTLASDGPRIWNSQLLRYAGHRGPNETVIGDPAELNYTDALKKHFNWRPKSVKRNGGEVTMFDLLPVVIQANPSIPPELFELPDDCICEIPIHHPEIRGISSLGLKWYGIPAVSNITLDLGGLKYTAAPFNGWYMVTEVATRNFGDESRYNLLPKIAEAMGIDISTEETLWRDHALAAINLAVLHSFKRSRISMVDHHTAAASFASWYPNELQTRGYCPGNWKWIIPPTASSTSSLYLGLNKMTEYTLKPALIGGMSVNALLKRAISSGFLTKNKEVESQASTRAFMKAAQAAAKWLLKSRKRVKGGIILFASDGGRTQTQATMIWSSLHSRLPMIRPIDMANTTNADFSAILKDVEFIMILSSTTGSGQIPSGSNKFINWAKSTEGRELLKGKSFAVCAFGSKAYPKFCAGGKRFAKTMQEVGCLEMYPIVCVDQLEDEDKSVREYMFNLFDWLHDHPKQLFSTALVDLMKKNLEKGSIDDVPFEIYIHDGEKKDVASSRIERSGTTAAVLTNRIVLGAGEALNTVQASFQIRNARAGVEYYKPGDHVAVWPRCSLAQARYFASHFGLNFSDKIELVPLNDDLLFKSSLDPAIPNPCSIKQLFMDILDINAEPSGALLLALSSYVDEGEFKEDLEELSRDENYRRTWLEQSGVKICTLFDYFPTISVLHRQNVKDGIKILRDVLLKIPKLRPRYYSISSSPLNNNATFDLTVGRLHYRGGGAAMRLNLGFCSDFLATMPLQSVVDVAIKPAPTFRLPRDSTCPILMIAGGTGIAPFKGFVDERQNLSSSSSSNLGDSWLIYGCRTQQNELYRNEMQKASENGHLTKYLVAYSREKDIPKTYIDVQIRNNADAIRDLILNKHGHIYVCGDVRIEVAAQNALFDIFGKEGVDQIHEFGQYHLDIFGSFDIEKQALTRWENSLNKLDQSKLAAMTKVSK